ncbi:LysR family transcriptional regulator [Microbacterium esteraromaticum]|uniref:LysR family transcriptional regulator n=1 Tax=Microbacterium esteraromaticum TaxID=57043 RepID=A0A939DUK7_9MICO|nr:LysR family transcriptional regulator [Microbacterium esteraromaticum]MBN7794356.1 LysR family transcriptional regulator [Microbacterium esteraromaticum]MBN8204358.1 LysR family transcriptional regulator [Microbacterium esteraromaticum]MBN8414512.1 LysR family transcriptional regulator [Microbacterium esteraromaticum]MBN8425226.1 LysR family transcriptional regulator [Microbacterium esteraromaticum]MBY6062186.1 LysR family transcriptional regulator [Microbacterium esteraromaticum]
MFELRRLRLLHELALRGTIAGVAASLSYSPSTVSQQLALLEREAGVPLLEPDGRRVRLTAEGRMLAEHAARALELDEAARAALSAPGALEPVRLAAMPTAAQTIVPAALTLLAERAPQLRVELAELPPEKSLFELSARRFDLVIAEQYPGHTREVHAGLEHRLLGEDPIRIVLPPDEEPRGLAELADRVWVMEPAGTAVRHWAVQQCRAAGFEPDVRFEADDLTAHLRLIAAGHAVGLLPDLIWGDEPSGMSLATLPGAPVREVFTAVRSAARASESVTLVRAALADAFAAHRKVAP